MRQSPGIVRGAFHGRKKLVYLIARDAAFAGETAAEVENLPADMLDAHRTHKLAGAARKALEEVVLRNENLALGFLCSSSRHHVSAGEQAFAHVQDNFLGTQRSSREVGRTELGAAAALDASIHIQDVLAAQVPEVNHAQVIAVVAQRAHWAGVFGAEKYRDRCQQQVQVFRHRNDHEQGQERRGMHPPVDFPSPAGDRKHSPAHKIRDHEGRDEEGN